MTFRHANDPGLNVLLDLHGEVLRLERGYWTKIEARLVARSLAVPHGIRYSLTLHDRHGKRVLGYDNAHAVKVKQGRFGTKRVARDHVHTRQTVKAYDFESASRLLTDFWSDVNRLMFEGASD